MTKESLQNNDAHARWDSTSSERTPKEVRGGVGHSLEQLNLQGFATLCFAGTSFTSRPLPEVELQTVSEQHAIRHKGMENDCFVHEPCHWGS